MRNKQTGKIIPTNLRKTCGLFYVFLITLGFAFQGRAQQYTFRNYTGDDGLSQLSAQALYQDRDGYIWVGTQAGLNCYDGNEFEIFSIRDGLKNDWINDITQDSTGRIWIATNGGLSSWNGEGFENYTTEEGLISKRILSLAVDATGNIWCGTNEGLYCWDGSSFQNLAEKSGLPETSIGDLLIDHTGRLWVASDIGLYYQENGKFTPFLHHGLGSERILQIDQDPANRLWVGLEKGVIGFLDKDKVAEYNAGDGLPGLPVISLLSGRDGVLWAGTNVGLAMIHNNQVQFITSSQGLPFDNVSCILEDREGNLWCGGFGGIARFAGRAFQTYTETDGLGSNFVRPILRDRKGALWVGTQGGLSQFDGKTWMNFTEKDGLNSNLILSLYEDSRGVLWVGNLKGLNIFDGKRFHDEQEMSKLGRVAYIIEDSNGVLWFSVRNVGLYRREKEGYKQVKVSGQTFRSARMLLDHSGNVWASGDHGLSRWDGKTWRTFTTDDGLADNAPYFICEDLQYRIWFGYHSSQGITCFDDHTFKTFTTKDGLYNDAVYSIGADPNGYLWIGTARGVDRFDGKNFINYATSEGYANNESNAGGFFVDHDSTLWFGTAGGLSHYQPALDNSLERPPALKIHRLYLGKQDILLTDSPVEYSQNDLQARIAQLSFINRKRLSFRYRLFGYDDDWKNLQGYEINYTNLPPGHYTLEVQARKHNNNWSEPAKAQFTIKPPFWQTWWFSLFALFSFLGSIYFIIFLRTKNLQKQRRKLEETVNERTAELAQQNLKLQKILKDRKQAEKALRESEDQFRTLVEHAPEALVVLDMDQGSFVHVNENAVKMFGMSREKLLKSNPTEISPKTQPNGKPSAEQTFEYISKALNGETPVFEWQLRNAQGGNFLCEVRLVQLPSAGRKLIRGSVINITERKQAEQEQARLMKRLERANRELKDFAYIVSHDLKSPLRAIGSLSDWLMTDYRDKLDEVGRDLIYLLNSRVKRMHGHIEGVLQYSSIGGAKEEKVKVDLNQVVQEAVDQLSPPKEIEIKIENELPLILFEKARIKQVFQNLLSNAVKYMDKPKGKIRIGSRIEKGHWKFKVADNGPGIDEKYFAKIFRIFQTLSPRDEVEGTGIGLSLVKKIIESHGGKIWVDSQIGAGSTFYFTLPKKDLKIINVVENAEINA